MVNTALAINHATRPPRLRSAPLPVRPRPSARGGRARRRGVQPLRRPEAVRGDLSRRFSLRLDPDQLATPQSQARWSFQPSQAATRHMPATRSNWPAGPTPTLLSAMATSEPITIAPELTILLAATVRAVSVLGTV